MFSVQARASDDGADEALPAKHHATRHESAEQAELRELREEMKHQQAEIEELKQILMGRTQQSQTAQQAASDALAQAAQAAQQASAAAADASTKVATLGTSINDLQAAHDTLQENVISSQAQVHAEIHEPGTIHYKNIEITPGGFVAAETVNRTRAINSDLNTPFNSTPYMNSGQAYNSEFNATARQSRLSVAVLAPFNWGRALGYYEMDFLGTGVTSNDNQSDSYVLRQRQIWGRIERNSGFALTAGQTWSLVTETRKGLTPATENLPQTIDSQYHVGFSWERQYAVRLAQTLGPLTVGVSFEEPQIVNYTSSTTPPDFFVGGIGTAGGLYNLTNKYSNNYAPDIIVKAALDEKFGHFEIGGIERTFRSRVYPYQTSNTTATAAVSPYNDLEIGGGIFANLRMPATKFVDIGLHVMGGDGTGRYGTSQLPDVTVHPNGELEPLRNAQGLFSLETHPAKKLDVFGYAGTEYAQRTFYVQNGTVYGYAPPSISVASCFTEQTTVAPSTGSTGGVFGGAPYDPSSSCGAQTRDITQGTAGFTYRFFNDPTRGRFQFSMAYSYLTKTAWAGLYSGTAFTPTAVYAAPHATNNMVWTSFRYYIP